MKHTWMCILFITVIAALLVPSAAAAGADSTLVETLQVSANSPVPKISVNTLQSGVTYLIKVSGTWQDTSVANHFIDAEYTTFDTWQTYMDGTPHWGPPQKDLNVNGADVNWGTYNPAHEYKLLYPGTGAPVSFMIIDKDPSLPIDPTWYTDNVGFLTVRIFKLNNAPIAEAGGPYSGAAGSTVVLSGGGSNDPDGDALTYTWDLNNDGLFNDAAGVTTLFTIPNNAPNNTVYGVGLKVTDPSGSSSTDSAVITVTNSAPVAVNQSVTTNEDTVLSIALGASGGDGDPLTYAVNSLPAHGMLSGTAPNLTYTPDANYKGADSFTFTANDGKADSNTAVISISINPVNDPPSADAGGPYAGIEGYAVALSGTATDIDGDTLTCVWDFGDSTTGNGAITSHTYLDDGRYTVTLTVTDSSGSLAKDTATVTVTNAAPVVSAGDDQTVYFNNTVQFAGSFTDAGQMDTHTYTWDFGDGNTATGNLNPTHIYTALGIYTATLTVTDNDGAATPDTMKVTVLDNVPPVITPPVSITLEQTSLLGTAYTLTSPAFTDNADPSPIITSDAPAVFPPGTTTVTWKVVDASGNTATVTQTVTVQDTKKPVTSATVSPDANAKGWNNTDVTVSMAAADNNGGSGVKEIQYTINDGPAVTIAGGNASFTLTVEGTYTVSYYAIDSGNNQETPQSMTVRIDKTAPAITISYPVNAAFYKSTSMPPSGSFNVNDSSAAVIESGYSTSAGLQTYIISATDEADNTGMASVSYTVDNMPPDILVNYPVSQAIYKLGTMPAVPDIVISDAVEPNPVYTLSGYDTTVGTHTLIISATDAAGNSSSLSIVYQVQKSPKTNKDTTGPVITITSPTAKTYYTYQTLKVYYGVYDKDSGVAGKQAFLDGAAVTNGQKIDLSTLTAGQHTLTVTAMDNVGNVSTKSVTFTIGVASIKAWVELCPEKIDLKANYGDRPTLTVLIKLPCEISEKNIDASSLMLSVNGISIPIVSVSRGNSYKINWQAFFNALKGTSGKLTVKVTGTLKDGTAFSGTDVITVTNNVHKK